MAAQPGSSEQSISHVQGAHHRSKFTQNMAPRDTRPVNPSESTQNNAATTTTTSKAQKNDAAVPRPEVPLYSITVTKQTSSHTSRKAPPRGGGGGGH